MHDIRYASSRSMQSLASQICDEASVLPGVDGLIHEHKVIRRIVSEYWKLCTLCLFIWLARMLQEFRDTVHFALAIGELHRGETRLGRAGRDNSLSLISMSKRGHMVTMVAVVVPRVVIAVLLTWCGILFLIRSADLSTLLTNTVKLAFIKDIDRFLFDAFGPRRRPGFAAESQAASAARSPLEMAVLGDLGLDCRGSCGAVWKYFWHSASSHRQSADRPRHLVLWV